MHDPIYRNYVLTFEAHVDLGLSAVEMDEVLMTHARFRKIMADKNAS